MDPKQEEQPPVEMSPRKRRRTAAVADVRVNQEAGTPVERLAREMGAEPVPELGRARDRDRDDGRENGEPDNDEPDRDFQQRSERALAGEPTPPQEDEVAVKPSEARRTLKARREHSKGDGNFPAVEPGPELLDERPEDRRPRDLPKARDARTAPKGNVTVGQEDRQRETVPSRPQRAEKPEVQTTARRRSSGRTVAGARSRATSRAGAKKSRPATRATAAKKRSGMTKATQGKPSAMKRRAKSTRATPRPKRRTARRR